MPPKGSRSVASSHETPSMYSTRATKRKVEGITASPEKHVSPKSDHQESLDDSEIDAQPPAKRIRKSVSSEVSSQQAEIDDVTEVPTVLVDSASGPSDSEPLQSQAVSPSPSRNTGTRGRGRGGRRRGGGRGRAAKAAKGGSGFGARGTPAQEFVPAFVKGARGKGGNRVKKTDNARIQALYHRRLVLKQQYKQVAQKQRYALEILAEKSLDSLSQPTYHETLPEFDEVTKELNARHQKVMDRLDAELKQGQDFLRDQLVRKKEYEDKMFQDKIDDITDKEDSYIKSRSLHVLRQAETGGDIYNTPIYRGILGVHVKKIEKTHHDPSQQIGLVEAVEEERRRPGRKRKNASPKKTQNPAFSRTKSSLYNPVAQQDDLVNLEDPSSAPTPAATSSDDETDAYEDLPCDKYGAHVPPTKPARRNAEPPTPRISVIPHLEFDPDEIGFRVHHSKRTNRGEAPVVGYDAFPNPHRFWADKTCHGWVADQNGPDDLDAEIVKQYKLHPTYGLCIPGSINPDREEMTTQIYPPRTDWSKPLPSPLPVVFYLENDDEPSTTFHTSRSTWIIEAKKDWEKAYPDEDSQARTEMKRMLQHVQGSNMAPPSTPSAQPVVNPNAWLETRELDDALFQAVNAAQAAEAASLTRVTQTPPPPPPPPAITTPRSTYDPVRDTGYQTPYQPVTPLGDTKGPSETTDNLPDPEDTISALILLRNASVLRGMVPYPAGAIEKSNNAEQRPALQSSWPPRFHVPLPPQPSMMEVQQRFMPYQPPPPRPTHPQPLPLHTSPTRGQATVLSGPAGLRELRPAPPQPPRHPPLHPPEKGLWGSPWQ